MRLKILAALAIVALPSIAFAQSNPGLTYKQVPTAGQWNSYFSAKQDTLGFTPLNTAGGTMSGRLVTAAPGATVAGFNLFPGTAPGSPANGDLWTTSVGLYVQINGSTVGPLTASSSGFFAATSPLSVSFPAGIVTYACATCGVTTSPLSQFAATTSSQLLGVISDESGSGLVVFNNTPTLITPILGVATATSINKVAITAPATSATLTIANGKTLTANSSLTLAGVDAKTLTINNSLTFAGTDATVMTFPGTSDTVVTLTATQTLTNKTLTAPTFTTPALGVGTGTSLALNGCAIGSNALCLVGASSLSGPVTITTANSSAIAIGNTGGTNPSFQVDSSLTGTGIKVTSKTAAGGVNLDAISSGTNEGLVINAKGNSGITIANTSTGVVDIGTGGGGLTIHGQFTATGLVKFAELATAAVASCAQYAAATASTLAASANVFCAETTTTFGATTTFDFSTFINTAVTLTANITTQTLSNVKAGQAGTIRFIQDATGSRTTVWNSVFKWVGGVSPALSTAANAIDVLSFSCVSATNCPASLMKDVR